MSSSGHAAPGRSVRVQLFPHNRRSNKAIKQIAAYRMRVKDNATFGDLASAVVTRYLAENPRLSDDIIEIQSMRDETNCDCSMNETLDLLEPSEMILAILAKPGASHAKPTSRPATTPKKASGSSPKSVPPPSLASRRSEVVSLLSENESDVIPDSQEVSRALAATHTTQQAGQGRCSTRRPALEENSDGERSEVTAVAKTIKQEKWTRPPAAKACSIQQPNRSTKPKSSLPQATNQGQTLQQRSRCQGPATVTTESTSGGKADPYDVLSDSEGAPTIATSKKKRETAPALKDVKVISITSSSRSDDGVSDASHEPESEVEAEPSSASEKSAGKRPQWHAVNHHVKIVDQKDLERRSSTSLQSTKPAYTIVNTQGSTLPVYRRGESVHDRATSKRHDKPESINDRGFRMLQDLIKQREQADKARRLEEREKLAAEKKATLAKHKRPSPRHAIDQVAKLMTSTKRKSYGRRRSESRLIPREFYEEREYSDEDLGSIIGDADSAEHPESILTKHSTKSLSKNRARTPKTPGGASVKDVTHLSSVKPMNKLYLESKEPPSQCSKSTMFGLGYSQRVRDAFSDSEQVETKTHDDSAEPPTTALPSHPPLRGMLQPVPALPAKFDEWCLRFKTTYKPDDSAEKHPVVADGPWEGLIIQGPRRGQYQGHYKTPSDSLIEELAVTAEPLSDVLSESSDSNDESSDEEISEKRDSDGIHKLTDPTYCPRAAHDLVNTNDGKIEEPSLPSVGARTASKAVTNQSVGKVCRRRLTEQYVLTGRVFATQAAQDADEDRSPTVPTEECESQEKASTHSTQSTTTTVEIFRQLEGLHDAKQPGPYLDAPPSNQELAIMMSSSPPKRRSSEQSPNLSSHDITMGGDSISISSSEASEGVPARVPEPATPLKRRRRTSDADLDVTPAFERALSQVETPSTKSRSAMRMRQRQNEKSDKSVRFMDSNFTVEIPEDSPRKRADYSRVAEESDSSPPHQRIPSEKQHDSPLKSFAEINSISKVAGANSQESSVAAVNYVLKHSPNWLNNVTELAQEAELPSPGFKSRSIVKPQSNPDLSREGRIETGSSSGHIEKPKSTSKKRKFKELTGNGRALQVSPMRELHPELKEKQKERGESNTSTSEPDATAANPDHDVINADKPEPRRKRSKKKHQKDQDTSHEAVSPERPSATAKPEERARKLEKMPENEADDVYELQLSPEHDKRLSGTIRMGPSLDKSKKRGRKGIELELEEEPSHEPPTDTPAPKKKKSKKRNVDCEQPVAVELAKVDTAEAPAIPSPADEERRRLTRTQKRRRKKQRQAARNAEKSARKKAKRERRAEKQTASNPQPDGIDATVSSPAQQVSKTSAASIPSPFAMKSDNHAQDTSGTTDKRSSWSGGLVPKSAWLYNDNNNNNKKHKKRAASKRQQSYRPPSPPNTSRPSSAGSLV